MSMPIRPHFRTLQEHEAEALLNRARIGRLAYVAHGHVDIEPIHFAYAQRWIYARTGAGTKLTTLTRNPWVALEVDEVDGDFDWRSAVAKGTAYFLDHDPSPRGVALRESVVAMLRRIIPETFTPSDPTPERDVMFRIHVDELHGRAASTREPRPDVSPGASPDVP